ncbi:suppressor of G2 allele of SKP1-like [Tropilaelaps mercedesae]|uniref:Suppressor of G2 allele of SKP1-like n=1 Tax=Tropilaelaps mercedesae TaxID=418985 RepID=A0A1V9XI40_9ACAR|nr:suppressor of G2 allele of SKP1-like [Tropilaelaps mercedesae]
MAQARHDWYQTESYITVEILLKNQKAEDVKVKFSPDALSASVVLPSGDYNLDLQLSHDIYPDKSSYKILPSKIEIRLAKTEALWWSALDRKPGMSSAGVAPTMVGPDQIAEVPRYPSSSLKAHDWDKLEKEIERIEHEETPEGEQAVKDLFQKIYRDGNDEVRKAMNKSYLESSGTVLSTNWDKVSTKKVDINPPDGTEFKKYDC